MSFCFAAWSRARSNTLATGWFAVMWVKGAPPLELANIDDVVKFVQATPGAIGYVPASKLPRSANIIFRR